MSFSCLGGIIYMQAFCSPFHLSLWGVLSYYNDIIILYSGTASFDNGGGG